MPNVYAKLTSVCTNADGTQRIAFPVTKSDVRWLRNGERWSLSLPLEDEVNPRVGDTFVFVEAIPDGGLATVWVPVLDGEEFAVTLTRADRIEPHGECGWLWRIAWKP